MKAPEQRYDIVGDVHGCLAELRELLGKLAYTIEDDVLRHQEGRRFVFLGDLVDRGPDTVGVLRLAMASVAAGTALCVIGNHDDKFRRALLGRPVKVKHGLAETLEQVGREPARFSKDAMAFIEDLPDHLILDDGRLVVAHAGLPEALHGGSSRRVRDFAMYGLTTGRVDAEGMPERLDWAADYSGQAMVAYGHTPVDGAGVGESDHRHRYRLRLRSPTHRASLSGAGVGVRGRAAHLHGEERTLSGGWPGW